MKSELLEKLIERLIIVSLPTPTVPTPSIWIIEVDGNKVYIESTNKITAYIKAKRKFPSAKKIRVIKRLNWWERSNFNYF
jgi:hypothetical protein